MGYRKMASMLLYKLQIFVTRKNSFNGEFANDEWWEKSPMMQTIRHPQIRRLAYLRFHHVRNYILPLISLLLFIILVTPLQAQSPESLVEVMTVANENYQTGNYADAIANYETLLEAGARHSAIYYNLGNAYLQQGDLGRAILNYRRAEFLSPRDGDIATNLAIARAQTVDQLDLDSSQPALGQIVGQWFTLNEMALLTLASWLIICIFICLAIMLPRWRRLWRWAIAGTTLLLMVGLIAIASNVYGVQQYPAAVVLAEEIDVTNSPNLDGESIVEFTLHAGAEVQLIERRLGWRHIALPGDLRGWVPSEAIALVEVDTH